MINNRVSRILLILAALLLAGGGIVHGLAFRKALPVIANSNLPAFFANAYKALWVADATTLISVALFYVYAAARPVKGPAVLLVTLVPFATAVLIYVFVGNFLPGHILIAASILAAVAAILSRERA